MRRQRRLIELSFFGGAAGAVSMFIFTVRAIGGANEIF